MVFKNKVFWCIGIVMTLVSGSCYASILPYPVRPVAPPKQYIIPQPLPVTQDPDYIKEPTGRPDIAFFVKARPAISKNGKFKAEILRNGEFAHLIDNKTGKEIYSRLGDGEWITSLKFSPDDKSIIVGVGYQSRALKYALPASLINSK